MAVLPFDVSNVSRLIRFVKKKVEDLLFDDIIKYLEPNENNDESDVN